MGDTLKFGKKFDREFGKIDKSISEQVVKKLNRLKENPENIGKPLLHTKPNLWEFKVGPFRILLYNSGKFKRNLAIIFKT